MVDELQTSDAVLLGYIDSGAEVYSIAYKEAKAPLSDLVPSGKLPAAGPWSRLLFSVASQLLNPVGAASTNEAEPGAGWVRSDDERKYMAARPRDEVSSEPNLLRLLWCHLKHSCQVE